MVTARRALVFSFAAQYGSILAQFITTIVVSRLMLPQEVGIYSIGAAMVSLGQVLRDFGTGQYIIQESELTDQRIRAAYTVTLGFGWALALLLLVLAPFAGRFYEQPGVSEVLTLLAVNFALLPFSTVTAACLKREMHFKPMMIARLAAAVVGMLVTTIGAFQGLSYMSMVWGSIASTLVTISIISYYRPKHLPFWPGLREVPRVLRFGGQLSFITILNEVAAALPSLVFGKILGIHATGIYSRALGTTALFSKMVLGGIGPVLNAFYAKKNRDRESLHGPYVTTISNVTGLAWPFLGVTAVLAEELTLTLFGPNWLEIVPLVQLMCLSHVLYHLTSTANQLLISTGRVKRLMRFTLIMVPLRMLVIVSLSFVGLEAVLWGMVGLALVRPVLLWPDIREITGATYADYGRIIFHSGAAAGMAVLVAWLVAVLLPMWWPLPAPFALLAAGTAAALAWLAAVWVIRHPVTHELGLVWRAVRRRLG